MSERSAHAPSSAIHLVAGNPNGTRHWARSSRMNSLCGNGSGAARLTGPSISCVSRNSTARTKSVSCSHDTYCAPPATGPPRPSRAMPRSTVNAPPRSGLITTAVRSAARRVAGVSAAVCAASQFRAISTLYAQ